MKRYSKKQAEFAAKVSNDIAEGIDCGESRKQLRAVISYWTDMAYQSRGKQMAAESRLALIKEFRQMINSILS